MRISGTRQGVQAGYGIKAFDSAHLVKRARLSRRSSRAVRLCIRAVKEAVIGIDLGTSNSAVAVIEDGKPVIIKVESERHTLPSVITIGQVRNAFSTSLAASQLIS